MDTFQGETTELFPAKTTIRTEHVRARPETVGRGVDVVNGFERGGSLNCFIIISYMINPGLRIAILVIVVRGSPSSSAPNGNRSRQSLLSAIKSISYCAKILMTGQDDSQARGLPTGTDSVQEQRLRPLSRNEDRILGVRTVCCLLDQCALGC